MWKKLMLFVTIVGGMLLFCTTAQALSCYKVGEVGKCDQWYAEGFGNQIWWLRNRNKPYNIEYAKIVTKDARVHRLRRI